MKIDDWLFTHYKFSAVFIKLRKLLIVVVHTDDTDGHGGPQADFMGERESSGIKRKLNGGPQADEVRKQVSINDDWLLIIDIVHTENTDDTDVRRRTVEWNANYRELIVN